jgi:CHAT domain-containing protein
VGDQSTKDLMDIFTDELFVPQHFFPAENLRQAILKYKAKNPDPADWAAFINMGTPYPPGMEVQMGLK